MSQVLAFTTLTLALDRKGELSTVWGQEMTPSFTICKSHENYPDPVTTCKLLTQWGKLLWTPNSQIHLRTRSLKPRTDLELLASKALPRLSTNRKWSFNSSTQEAPGSEKTQKRLSIQCGSQESTPNCLLRANTLPFQSFRALTPRAIEMNSPPRT